MIWYLHWLDLRWRLLLVAAASLAGVSMLPASISLDLSAYTSTGRFPRSIEPYGSLLPSVGVESFYVWAEYSNYLLTLLMFCPLLVTDGSSLPHLSRTSNVYLTLSFPVSRWRLTLTRFFANWVALVASCAIFTAASTAIVMRQGLPLPWEPMLATSAMALIAVTPLLAGSELLNILCDTPARVSAALILGFVPWLLFTMWMARAARNVAVLAESPVVLLAVAIAGSAAALGLAAAAAREKEY